MFNFFLACLTKWQFPCDGRTAIKLCCLWSTPLACVILWLVNRDQLLQSAQPGITDGQAGCPEGVLATGVHFIQNQTQSSIVWVLWCRQLIQLQQIRNMSAYCQALMKYFYECPRTYYWTILQAKTSLLLGIKFTIIYCFETIMLQGTVQCILGQQFGREWVNFEGEIFIFKVWSQCIYSVYSSNL